MTVVAIQLIDADSAVAARIAGTFVHIDGAFRACPSWLAGAIIAAGLHGGRGRNKQSKRAT